MTHHKVLLLSVLLGCAQTLQAATVTKFSKKLRLIEVSGDADELLGIGAGATVDLTFGETTAEGVVKKVVPGNRLHIEVQGDVTELKKGLELEIVKRETAAPAEVTDEDAEPEEKPAATIVKVGKNRIALKSNPQWDADLRKLKKGDKIKVFFSNRTEAVTLMFDKAGKFGFEFLFRKADKVSMVKDVEVSPYQEEAAGAPVAAGSYRTPVPWFNGSSASHLFAIKGKFLDLGYQYSELNATHEVDGNSGDEREINNAVNVGFLGEFGLFRGGVNIARVTWKTEYEYQTFIPEILFGTATKYFNAGIGLAPFSISAKGENVTLKSSGVLYGLLLGWSSDTAGITGSYEPGARSKAEVVYKDPSSGEETTFKSSRRYPTHASLHLWMQAHSALRLYVTVANDYNDGGAESDREFERDEKILANERVSLSAGGTWVGESGFQFDTGIARNKQGLRQNNSVYNSRSPSTGLYFGLAKQMGSLVVGSGIEFQKGGIVRENEEAGFDLTTTAELKMFSLMVGSAL